MGQSPIESKVYLEIVEKIREIIDENKLGPGDKLPSERELSDRLNAGRSSVREALRALELLGLIETRRGEGTFISDFRNHRLVQLLSSFILQNDQAKKDVQSTMQLLEIICLYVLIQEKTHIEETKILTKDHMDRKKFFDLLFLETDNFLLRKIWTILLTFESSLQMDEPKIEKHAFEKIIHALNNKELQQAIEIYFQEIRKVSNPR